MGIIKIFLKNCWNPSNYESCRSTRRLAGEIKREGDIILYFVLLPLPLLLFVSLKTQTRENIYQSSVFVYQVIHAVNANQTVMYLIMK